MNEAINRNATEPERMSVGIFGRTNVGKSSLINALSGQSAAIVSAEPGTTTDPVRKTMELLPIGPIVLIDTAGIDDESINGALRIEKTEAMLRQTDLVLYVIDEPTLNGKDSAAFSRFRFADKPLILVRNLTEPLNDSNGDSSYPTVDVNCLRGDGITDLKDAVIKQLEIISNQTRERFLLRDLLRPADTVILVTPIDSGAPRGRIILPQQQVLREVLDARAVAIVLQPEELADVLARYGDVINLVVTDSQVFKTVAAIVPDSIPLLSFSMLGARYKGNLARLAEASLKIDQLQDGDRILIAEGCTHHRQCEDIGTVKIPRQLRAYSGCDVRIETVSGGEFPQDLSPYKLVLHCGACMLNHAEMTARFRTCEEQGIAVTNYGIAIAKMTAVLERCMASFAMLENREV